MRCDWDSLLKVLPPGIRPEVDAAGRQRARELRLRLGREPELVLDRGFTTLNTRITGDDLHFVVNSASRYSPWAAGSMRYGYLTISGGHRIGIGGSYVSNGTLESIQSLCIRVARDVDGIADGYRNLTGSTLIIGPPGWGKTTLLRDLSRVLADKRTTAVIDDRGELFPAGFARGKRMDVLTNCPKQQGIDMALRTLGPEIIAVDEVTQIEDCDVLVRAAHCGVWLLATAHASDMADLRMRERYREMLEGQLFPNILILNRNGTCVLERGSK